MLRKQRDRNIPRNEIRTLIFGIHHLLCCLNLCFDRRLDLLRERFDLLIQLKDPVFYPFQLLHFCLLLFLK